MRRAAVAQRVEQPAEGGARLRGADAEHLERRLLQLRAVDAQRAAADLDAVDHQVVGARARRARVGAQPLQVRLRRRGERVVHRLPALARRVALEQREVHHPQRPPAVLAQIELVREQRPQVRQRGVDRRRVAGAEQQQVAGCSAGAFQQARDRRVRQELEEAGLQTGAAGRRVAALDPGQAFRAVRAHRLGVFLDALQADPGAARQPQRRHPAAGPPGRLAEDLEVDRRHQVGEVNQLQAADAQVRPVGAVAA